VHFINNLDNVLVLFSDAVDFIQRYYLHTNNLGIEKDESLAESKKLAMILEPVTWKCSNHQLCVAELAEVDSLKCTSTSPLFQACKPYMNDLYKFLGHFNKTLSPQLMNDIKMTLISLDHGLADCECLEVIEPILIDLYLDCQACDLNCFSGVRNTFYSDELQCFISYLDMFPDYLFHSLDDALEFLTEEMPYFMDHKTQFQSKKIY